MSKMTTSDFAAEFAKKWHGEQKRKYIGIPYWKHLESVVDILKHQSEAYTDEMIAAAWLHDVIEDTPCTYEHLVEEFGVPIAKMVWWVTDRSTPEDGNRKIRKDIDRNKFYDAPPEAKTIKLADIIDNTNDITTNDPAFAVVYLQEKALLLPFLIEGDEQLMITAQLTLRQALRVIFPAEKL